MKIFTSANISGLDFVSMVRKPEKLAVAQVDEDFQVPRPNGDDLRGVAGDYLVCDLSDRIFVVSCKDMNLNYRFFDPELDK